jgi:hypothetical protein
MADLDEAIVATVDGPVHTEVAGKDVAVLLSPEQYAALAGPVARVPRAELERLMAASTERHGSVYRALAKWEAENEPPEA